MNLVYDLKKILIIKNRKENQNKNDFNVIIDGIKPETSNEDIYDLAHEIIKILSDGKKTINIYKEYNNVIDKPNDEPVDPNQPKTFTEDFTLTKGEIHIALTNKLTDENVYGAALDGKERKVKLYYLGTAVSLVTQIEVPLDGFDTTKPPNPNGAFSFDSTSNTILFKTIASDDTKYRIVKGE